MAPFYAIFHVLPLVRKLKLAGGWFPHPMATAVFIIKELYRNPRRSSAPTMNLFPLSVISVPVSFDAAS
jgi:hypothetical protein